MWAPWGFITLCMCSLGLILANPCRGDDLGQDNKDILSWPHESIHYFMRRSPTSYGTTLAPEEEANPKTRQYWTQTATFADIVGQRDDVEVQARDMGGAVYDASFELELPAGLEFPSSLKAIDIDFIHCPTDLKEVHRRQELDEAEEEQDPDEIARRREFTKMMEEYEKEHPSFHICAPDGQDTAAVNQRRRLEYFGALEQFPAQRVAGVVDHELASKKEVAKVSSAIQNFTFTFLGGFFTASNRSYFGSKGPAREIANPVQVPARLFTRDKRFPKSLYSWYEPENAGTGTATGSMEGLHNAKKMAADETLWRQQFPGARNGLQWGGNVTDVESDDSVIFSESDYCPGIEQHSLVFHSDRRLEQMGVLETFIAEQTKDFILFSQYWQAISSFVTLAKNPNNPRTTIIRIVEVAVPEADASTIQIGLTQNFMEDKQATLHPGIYPNQTLAMFHLKDDFHLASRIIKSLEWKIPDPLQKQVSSFFNKIDELGHLETTHRLRKERFLSSSTASELGLEKPIHQMSSLVPHCPLFPKGYTASTSRPELKADSSSRVLSPGGLHRQMEYVIRGAISSSHVMHPTKCNIILSQRLEKTTYFDLDELREIERSGTIRVVSFSRYIDVELPASNSNQQQVLIQQLLQAPSSSQSTGSNETALKGFSQFTLKSFNASRRSNFYCQEDTCYLDSHLSLPVHFRYQAPGCSTTDNRNATTNGSNIFPGCYGSAYIPDPKFFLQCGVGSEWIPVVTRRTGWPVSVGTWIPKYHQKFLQASKIVKDSSFPDSPVHPFCLSRKVKPYESVYTVPIGMQDDFPLVSIITAVITIAAAVVIGFVALNCATSGGKAKSE